MTSEDDFFGQIDETREEWLNYLVFADFLQDRGDARADGMRALAALKVQPCWVGCGIFDDAEIEVWRMVSPEIRNVFWWCQPPWHPDPKQDRFNPYRLPEEWYKMQAKFSVETDRSGGYPSRRDAINGAARAFALLRPELQSRYLEGVVNYELDGTDDGRPGTDTG